MPIFNKLHEFMGNKIMGGANGNPLLTQDHMRQAGRQALIQAGMAGLSGDPNQMLQGLVAGHQNSLGQSSAQAWLDQFMQQLHQKPTTEQDFLTLMSRMNVR